jgi:Protein of unknown function (DUF2971)
MRKTFLPETQKELTDLKQRLLENSWEPLHRQPGKILWHYTTADGLKGILESCRQDMWQVRQSREGTVEFKTIPGACTIRATNVFYMNDTREVSYAQNLMVEEISKKKGVYPDPADEFLERAEIGIGITSMVFQPHVTCFCDEESGDLLSQWRGYTSAGGGYAIGFRSNSLASHGPSIQLRKVIYDETLQRKLVEETIDEFCTLLSTLAPSVSSATAKLHAAIGDFSYMIANVFHEYVYCFKHPKFADEREWRLVQRVVPYKTADKSLVNVEQVQFRVARGLLIPYAELNIGEQDPNDSKWRFPIEQINIGPTLRQDLAENSLKQILNKHEYDVPPIKIECSDIPLAW